VLRHENAFTVALTFRSALFPKGARGEIIRVYALAPLGGEGVRQPTDR
jgi:hypothetical protein